MAERNIDKLRNEDEVKVAEFLVELFDRLQIPIPMNLCDKCKHCKKSCTPVMCPYSETHFMLAWLYSERIGVK